MRLTLRILLLIGIAILPRCSPAPVAGGDVTETGNARVGAVVVTPQGQPAAHATVRLRRADYVTQLPTPAKSTVYGADAVTDSLGRFEIRGIDSGAYRIEVTDNATSTVVLACTLSHGDTLDFGTATMQPYAVVRGTLDTAGRSSVQRLYAQVQGLERIAEVNAQGSLTLGNLCTGVFDLWIRSADAAQFPPVPLHGIPVVSGDTARVTTVIPPPWKSIGIGETPQGGVALVNGTVVISGGGPDIYGASDGFHFVYQARQGDVSLIARVRGIEFTDSNAKACLMIRQDLSESSPNVAMEMEPPGWPIFQWRDAPADTSDYDGAVPTVSFPQWIKLERKGDTLTGYNSADGVTWRTASSRVVVLPPDVYVGLGVTSHDGTRLCAAVFDNVAISP